MSRFFHDTLSASQVFGPFIPALEAFFAFRRVCVAFCVCVAICVHLAPSQSDIIADRINLLRGVPLSEASRARPMDSTDLDQTSSSREDSASPTSAVRFFRPCCGR